MDKLIGMRVFVEIVDRGSLTHAAESLGRSLPSVVRILARLEEHLGVRLLTRTTRRMALTPEGRDFLARARRILADVEEAESAMTAGQSEPAGALRITAPVRFGRMHVAPALVAFAERHPRVSVDLVLLDRVVDLVEEGLDAGVRLAPLADSSMVAIPVGSVQRVIVASPSLLDRVGEPTAPEQLTKLPCVVFSGMSTGGVWRFAAEGRDRTVPIEGRFRSNHATSALEACAAGLGFGQFLSYQAAPFVRSGRLRVVLAEAAPAPVPVSLVYPDRRLVSTRLRACLDALRDALRGRSFAAH
ncbi:MAG: LysR family transcriptional regulator [bacterium]